MGFPPVRYGQRARYNKTIPVVAMGVAVGREGPNPVGYKCSGCFLRWTVVGSPPPPTPPRRFNHDPSDYTDETRVSNTKRTFSSRSLSLARPRY